MQLQGELNNVRQLVMIRENHIQQLDEQIEQQKSDLQARDTELT
jgi:predicted transcriptional regulator